MRIPLLAALLVVVPASSALASLIYQQPPKHSGGGSITHYSSGAPDAVYISPRDATQDTRVGYMNFATTSDEYRGVLEYNLSSIPDHATITTASVGFSVNAWGSYTEGGVTNYSTLVLSGSAGDGLLTASDVTANLTQLGSALINSSAYKPVSIPIDFLQPLVAGDSSYLTLQVRSVDAGSKLNFVYYSQPYLTITYSVPEPTVGLIVLACAGICLRRNRRA